MLVPNLGLRNPQHWRKWELEVGALGYSLALLPVLSLLSDPLDASKQPPAPASMLSSAWWPARFPLHSGLYLRNLSQSLGHIGQKCHWKAYEQPTKHLDYNQEPLPHPPHCNLLSTKTHQGCSLLKMETTFVVI